MIVKQHNNYNNEILSRASRVSNRGQNKMEEMNESSRYNNNMKFNNVNNESEYERKEEDELLMEEVVFQL